MARLARAACAAAALAGLTACAAEPDDVAARRLTSSPLPSPSTSTAASPSTSPVASPEAVPALIPSAPGPPAEPALEPPAPSPAAPGRAPAPRSSPLELPAGPAVVPPVRPPAAPGTLGTVDWAQWSHQANCPVPQVGAAVLGDLDGDRVDEVAVPLTCPDGVSSVLVYAGDAARPRVLGTALPAEEQARVQAVQVRDGHLVVAAFTWEQADRSGEPDTAVTSRWVVQGQRLVRVDRWEDPAHVLHVDE